MLATFFVTRDLDDDDANAIAVCILCILCCRRVSVCLSHAGTVPKWLNVGSSKQRHTIAHGL